MQWITTTCYVSAVSNNSPGRVAALVCRQVSVTLAAIASFAYRLYIFSLDERCQLVMWISMISVVSRTRVIRTCAAAVECRTADLRLSFSVKCGCGRIFNLCAVHSVKAGLHNVVA